MGQRLNIEIKEGNTVFANAYYHWSGYTSSALELTNIILSNIDNISNENKLITAIRLLESTGAGLTEDESIIAPELIPNFDRNDYQPCQGRNNGLISISEDGMHETRNWEEARVEIDLLNKTVNFDVLYTISKKEYDEYEPGLDFESIPTLDIDFENIPFDKFSEISESVINLLSKKIYRVNVKGESNILGFIA